MIENNYIINKTAPSDSFTSVHSRGSFPKFFHETTGDFKTFEQFKSRKEMFTIRPFNLNIVPGGFKCMMMMMMKRTMMMMMKKRKMMMIKQQTIDGGMLILEVWNVQVKLKQFYLLLKPPLVT